MSRRRALQGLGLLALGVVVLAAYLWLTAPWLDLSDETMRKVNFDMHESEIVKLVGGPATHNGHDSLPRHKPMKVEAYSQEMAFTGEQRLVDGPHNASFKTWKQWRGNGKALVVELDERGKVATKIQFTFEETIWDRMKRYLRID